MPYFPLLPDDAGVRRILASNPAAVFAAGWGERELHDAVLTVCLFHFMSRLLEGHGAKRNAALYATRGQALRDDGYAPLLRMLAGDGGR